LHQEGDQVEERNMLRERETKRGLEHLSCTNTRGGLKKGTFVLGQQLKRGLTMKRRFPDIMESSTKFRARSQPEGNVRTVANLVLIGRKREKDRKVVREMPTRSPWRLRTVVGGVGNDGDRDIVRKRGGEKRRNKKAIEARRVREGAVDIRSVMEVSVFGVGSFGDREMLL
jgi:hypothetical protein